MLVIRNADKQRMMASARTGKFVANALVPKFVLEKFRYNLDTLDFGCGFGDHIRSLYKSGFLKVYGADLDFTKTMERIGYVVAMRGDGTWTFSQIYASNVLNVQPTAYILRATCEKIGSLLQPGGLLLWNYPPKPRYMPGFYLPTQVSLNTNASTRSTTSTCR